MESSPLLKLPAELRDTVFELALCTHNDTGDNHTVTVSVQAEKPRITTPYPVSRVLALTATCKKLRAETLPIFYGCNTFNILVESLRSVHGADDAIPERRHELAVDRGQTWPWCFERWLRAVGRQNIACIRRIKFDLGHYKLRPRQSPRFEASGEHSTVSTAQAFAGFSNTLKHAGRLDCTVKIVVTQSFDIPPPSGRPYYFRTLKVEFPLGSSLLQAQEVIEDVFETRSGKSGYIQCVPDIDRSLQGQHWKFFTSNCRGISEVLLRKIWEAKESSGYEFDWEYVAVRHC
ncbi:hypothetical protein LTR37_011432 [Vermiconidia calcicola]|uniref:Uncharacterized protein n=1 Tax=Vermiconidia calcicola TaxID=1690605 RepID=A0ACC3N394_9PEZI|nr:hypothetical protein LTR37_011432 [Vermiconidia calcicola]